MNSHFSPPSPIIAAYNHDTSIVNEEPTTPLPLSGPMPPMTSSSPLPPPIVYGELSILGYNGLIPNGERSGRRNKSKYLLCRRPQSNGIKKSRHYIVKQPQATRAIQDKGLHSISYTFSRTQTIIVEYRQDETTDMFQIGRSSEEPIDFVVMDTLPTNCNNLNDNNSSSGGGGGNSHGRHHSSKHHHNPSTTASSVVAAASSSASASSSNYPHHYPNHQVTHNENLSTSHQQQMMRGDLLGIARLHRHLVKADEEMAQYGFPPTNDSRNHRIIHGHLPDISHSSVLLNYPPPNISNLQPIISNQFRYQDPSMFHNQLSSHMMPNASQQNQQLYLAAQAANSNHSSSANHHQSSQREHSSSRHNPNNRHSTGDSILCTKRSHTTQSTISRFACRVLVDREPPYTARIYAAGFDSSKNIFLGEKATKWEQDNVIDGLTTNGVLLMHPKRGYFQESAEKPVAADEQKGNENDPDAMDIEGGDNKNCSNSIGSSGDPLCDTGVRSTSNDRNDTNNSETNLIASFNINKSSSNNDSNNNKNNTAHSFRTSGSDFEYGGIWREVSVDGGIYAIRESRSATQKGRRIDNETNILQDGTLIDLCGATLLWRSLEGFKAAPTKRSLEEKIDMLNASRPQCPVGLNTLVIPRKPILPNNNHRSHNHHHQHRKESYIYSKDGLADDKSGHQPYVYLKCGHVQGYHNWGATEKANQRTCPICLSVGHVAKLSMGLEPSFYVDSGPLTYVFNPCGHMASERTVKYWCSISIPHGTHFFHAICPFCATPLTTNEPPSTRIIFQEDSD